MVFVEGNLLYLPSFNLFLWWFFPLFLCAVWKHPFLKVQTMKGLHGQAIYLDVYYLTSSIEVF